MTTQGPGLVTTQAEAQGISAAEIASRIEKKSGVTVVSRISTVSWFPRRSALEVQQALLVTSPEEHRALYESLRPTVLVAGKPCPLGNAGLKSQRLIFEIFENDEEIRVYTLGQDSPPGLIRLSKVAPNFTIRDFTMSAFIDEVADEWSEFADSMSTAEKEREAVLDYGGALPIEYSLSEFLQDVKDQVHLEGTIEEDGEDEDEEEDEKDEPEATTTAPANSPEPPITSPQTPAAIAGMAPTAKVG